MIISPRKMRIAVVGIVSLLLFTVSFFARYSAGKNLGGDQVHYLVMTGSFLEDRDFNLRNDYDLKRYFSYYSGSELDLHVPIQFNAKSPTLYSLHNPGIPILISPFVKIFGYNRGAIIAMLLLGLLTIVLTYFWCVRVTKSVGAALFASLVLFSSVSYLSLVGYVFPNLITASLTLGALLLLENKNRSVWQHFLLGLLLGVGPWIHVKVLLPFALIGFLALIQIVRNKKDLKPRIKEVFALSLAPFVLLLLFEFKLYEWYGVLLPSQTFAGGQLFLLSPLKSLAATLFDSTKGFFTNNPALLFMFVGLPIWLRKAPKQFLLLAFILLPGYLLQLTFSDWWGGWSPTGRYLIEMIPVAMPAVAFVFLLLKKSSLRFLCAVLIASQIAISLTYLLLRSPWVWVGKRNPVFEKISQVVHLNIDTYMPHFGEYLQTQSGDWKYVLIFGSVCVCLLLFGFSQRNTVRTTDSI